jgi:hypothetical protein
MRDCARLSKSNKLNDVIDFPLPDSPTTAIVREGFTSNETFRIALCHVFPWRKEMLKSRTRSKYGLLLLLTTDA